MEPTAPPALTESETYHVRIAEDRWATLRHVVEAVAIVLAGVWAFYTFVYTEKIKPAGEPAALSVTISVKSLGRSSTRDDFGYALTFSNTGKTVLDVAADGYNIWGERYGARPVLWKRDGPNRHEYSNDLPIVSRRLITAFAELRAKAVGGRALSHIEIEPGSTETIAGVFAVPRGAYDVIQAQVIAVPVKTSAAQVVVRVLKDRVGGYWLQPPDGVDEDDNSTEFVVSH
jgi:hypothetical protein